MVAPRHSGAGSLQSITLPHGCGLESKGLGAAWHTEDKKAKAPHLFRASMEVFHLAEKSCTTGAASLGP